MNTQIDVFEEIQATLTQLRQDPMTRRRFPKELWESIISLTQVYPIAKVCNRLNINPVYLKRKMHQSQKPIQLDFQEISQHIKEVCPDTIVIELSSDSGLKARVQGPLSCLNCLQSLFKE